MTSRVQKRLLAWPLGLIILLIASVSIGYSQNGAEKTEQSRAPVFSVDGKIALASLVSLGDGHLQKMADSLRILAGTRATRTANWERIRGPLGELGKLNVPAVLWFGLPDGSYWTVEEGKSRETLASRRYFSRLLKGESVIGDLVVSKATGKSTAIVAVPIKRRDGSVAGALGCSVYLDKLSALIKQEMELPADLIFYSFDAEPLLALEWDSDLIFVEPKKLSREIDNAFTEMLSKERGVVTYSFRGKSRTVLYRKSPVTQWWYALGLVEQVDASKAQR